MSARLYRQITQNGEQLESRKILLEFANSSLFIIQSVIRRGRSNKGETWADIITVKNWRVGYASGTRRVLPARDFHEFVSCHMVTPAPLYNSIKRKLGNFPADSSLSVTFCFAAFRTGGKRRVQREKHDLESYAPRSDAPYAEIEARTQKSSNKRSAYKYPK